MSSLPQNMPSTMVPSSMRAISSSSEAMVVSRATCWPGTSSRLNVAGISNTGGGLTRNIKTKEKSITIIHTYGGLLQDNKRHKKKRRSLDTGNEGKEK